MKSKKPQTQQQEILIDTVEKLLSILNPDFVCKSAKVRVLDDNGYVVKIRSIRCEYVYSDEVKKTVILEI